MTAYNASADCQLAFEDNAALGPWVDDPDTFSRLSFDVLFETTRKLKRGDNTDE